MVLGTALWVLARLVWLGFFVVVIGSDLRARAEEALLENTFGERYREYRSLTYRFVPGSTETYQAWPSHGGQT